MKLFEVVDQFADSEFTTVREQLRHLYHVQKAKCHAIDVFIIKLARKFPDWWKNSGRHFWGPRPTQEWDGTRDEAFGSSIASYSLPTNSSSDTTVTTTDYVDIRKQFRTKYEEMKDAKRRYEHAGGTYYE